MCSILFPRSWQTRAPPNPCRERESAFPKSRVTLVHKKPFLRCGEPLGSRVGSWRESQSVPRGRLSSLSHYKPVALPCFRSEIRSVALARVGVLEQDFGRWTRFKRFFRLPAGRCQTHLTSFHCSLLKIQYPKVLRTGFRKDLFGDRGAHQ